MRSGSHRAKRDRGWLPWVAGAAVLALAGAAVWVFVLGDVDIPLIDDQPDVPEFSFDFGVIRGVPIGDPAGQTELQEAAEAIRETLDAMYIAAFVDPDKWEDGTHPEVLDAFTGAAAQRAQHDLANLALAADAPKTAFVQPETGRLTVRFLIDDAQALTAAVASAQFSAGGELKDGRPLIVQHEGTYYMRPTEGDWRIVGYDVRGIVTSGTVEEPTAGGSP